MSEQLAITPAATVSDIAARYPAALRMLEAFGIDYCCGGKLLLAEAAAKAGVAVETVIAVLGAAVVQGNAADTERDWQTAPLEELMRHIVATHHAFLDSELPRVETILATVVRVHGPSHSAVLYPLNERYTALKAELTAHLRKEETETFPAIARLVRGAGDAAAVRAISELEEEHEAAGALLHAMREITGDYTLPEGVCNTYRALYAGLQALEADIHQHIHLENNILFPRARGVLQRSPPCPKRQHTLPAGAGCAGFRSALRNVVVPPEFLSKRRAALLPLRRRPAGRVR